MELLIVRHGPAGDREAWRRGGRPDADRPLTKDGRRRARAAAKGLRKVVGRVDLVATSPWTRAAQTAALVADACGGTLVSRPELVPDRPHGELLRWLGTRREKRVVLVGHEPHLSRFSSWLLSGLARSALKLKKSQAVLLDLPRPSAGAATLVWSLAPRQLRALAR